MPQVHLITEGPVSLLCLEYFGSNNKYGQYSSLHCYFVILILKYDNVQGQIEINVVKLYQFDEDNLEYIVSVKISFSFP